MTTTPEKPIRDDPQEGAAGIPGLTVPVRPTWADVDSTSWCDDLPIYKSAPITVDGGDAAVTLTAAWTPPENSDPPERGIFIDLVAGDRLDLDGARRLEVAPPCVRRPLEATARRRP